MADKVGQFVAGMIPGVGPVLSTLIGAGSSIAGGLLGDKASSESTSGVSPAYAGLQQKLIDMITGRLNSDSLPPGYETGGISSINHTYDAGQAALNADLTSRGLASSPVAAAGVGNLMARRLGQIGTFRTQIPLVQRQLQNEDLGMGSNLLGFGRTLNTNQTSGGGAAGAATNLAQYLGYLTTHGMFGKPAGTDPNAPPPPSGETPGLDPYNPFMGPQLPKRPPAWPPWDRWNGNPRSGLGG